MSVDSDSPATKALFQVAIESEQAREYASSQPGWHASVDKMIPSGLKSRSIHDPSQWRCGPSNNPEYDRSRHRHSGPVKTAPPLKAVSVNGSSLVNRIDSLTKFSLVGKWYFPEMNEDEMRRWITSTWGPLIGYTPIISRLMKDWFSFHFQKESDREAVLNRPWVFGRSFLSLANWYLGFDPLKNTPAHSMI